MRRAFTRRIGGGGKKRGDRTASFTLVKGVTIKGGYAGFGEPSPDARDIKLYETVLSGDLNGDDVGGMDDVSRSENSYSVVRAEWGDETPVIDGFTITGGNADGPSPYDMGGGIYCMNAWPTVVRCTFKGNSAIGHGGGCFGVLLLDNCTFIRNKAGDMGGGAYFAYTGNASTRVRDCVFVGNSAWHGGGVANLHSNTIFVNCTFTGNSTRKDKCDQADGGGMYNLSSDLIVTGCTFEQNSACGYGGAGVCNYESNATLVDCVFNENRSETNGGGIVNRSSRPTISHCTFTRNWAPVGAGMLNTAWGGPPSNPTVTDCLFIGNRAGAGGAGINNADGANPVIRNCTFAANVSTVFGGAIYFGEGATGTVTNCILWGDVPSRYEISLNTDTPPGVNYSCIQGGWPGVGNIDSDPLFVDPVAGNCYLAARSPCVDAGDPGYLVQGGEHDMNGDPRLVNGRIDMGADESTGGPSLVKVSSKKLMSVDGRFVSVIGGPGSEPLILNVQNMGSGTLAWEIAEDCPWLEVEPRRGESSGEADEGTLRVDTTEMNPALYSCELTVTAPGAANSPLRIPVEIYFLVAEEDEEFVGPFPSWLDVKADYGAVGDGVADDTAAIQKALDQIRQPDGSRRVVFLAAGTYRITSTLRLERQSHREAHGVGILGEDPSTTAVVWDGPAGEAMLYYNAWWARVGRLTLDGRGKAKTAVRHGPAFTSANEFADMVFKDVDFGIEAGEYFANGIAETAVLRCKFLRCREAGITMTNWNSLDWWI